METARPFPMKTRRRAQRGRARELHYIGAGDVPYNTYTIRTA